MAELGGPSAVADLLEAPVSTVFSFKRKISRSRLAHLKLAAAAAGKEIDWNAAVEPVTGEGGVGDHGDGHDGAAASTPSPGNAGQISGTAEWPVPFDCQPAAGAQDERSVRA
jgi:hypothetical protein